MNIGIRPSANSIKNETGCKAGSECMFPHFKVVEQRNKKAQVKATIPTKEEKAMTRMLWLL